MATLLPCNSRKWRHRTSRQWFHPTLNSRKPLSLSTSATRVWESCPAGCHFHSGQQTGYKLWFLSACRREFRDILFERKMATAKIVAILWSCVAGRSIICVDFLGRFSHNCEKRLLASSCLSAWNNSAPTGRIFMKFDIWVFCEKTVEKIQDSLKSDNNNRHFTWSPTFNYYKICRENSNFIKTWQ